MAKLVENQIKKSDRYLIKEHQKLKKMLKRLHKILLNKKAISETEYNLLLIQSEAMDIYDYCLANRIVERNLDYEDKNEQ